VTAEVLFANGNREAAIEAAQSGLDAAGDPDPTTPADCDELLRRALQRYGR